MHFSLANGHENGHSVPATAMSEPPKLDLIGIPLVAELERMIAEGKGWSREFEERADQVSIALFGVTKADTQLPAPSPDDFYPQGAKSIDAQAYDAAAAAWLQRELNLAVPAAPDFADDQLDDWWYWERDVDATDADGNLLRCLPYIDRQLNAAIGQLLPGAVFTPDGSGTRATASVEAWGSNLAADAVKFIGRRK